MTLNTLQNDSEKDNAFRRIIELTVGTPDEKHPTANSASSSIATSVILQSSAVSRSQVSSPPVIPKQVITASAASTTCFPSAIHATNAVTLL